MNFGLLYENEGIWGLCQKTRYKGYHLRGTCAYVFEFYIDSSRYR